MTLTELVQTITDRGIELTLDQDGLRYRALKRSLSHELRQALLEHKAELIDLLRLRLFRDVFPGSRAVFIGSKAEKFRKEIFR